MLQYLSVNTSYLLICISWSAWLCSSLGVMFFDQYQVAETARKLGIMVISDEVYGHLTFGSTPFVPMGVFASTVPVLTLGSISKRWIVPGWRMGWLVTNDPNGILQDSGVGSLSLPRSRCIEVVFFLYYSVGTDSLSHHGSKPSVLFNDNIYVCIYMDL